MIEDIKPIDLKLHLISMNDRAKALLSESTELKFKSEAIESEIKILEEEFKHKLDLLNKE